MTTIMERAGSITAVEDWYPICELTDLEPEWGEAALVDGVQVAVFRLWDDRVVITANRDPRTGSAVIARGIIGSHQGVPTIASPLYKEAYSLHTGECLSNPDLRLELYPSRVVDGTIQVAVADSADTSS
ncbi:nitrite reductase small subunit NirD [Microlunatus sp. Gsoil 973]|jgi:nitrite reductase (NADH) small subunit|uniref:nitrite reductase small subunit NirD n=1 Tax=Microlunatus sp. Gsoil 973 TaxID=2672569 RepID=UPI0012B4AA61|nr:nitrite reductase small subunit NirD [Microlunatus sp. Gsoil 973]QGN34694.1 nitrite reductase small subunit NirD [Microlunatus sp. Gsoil 973]